MNYDTSAARAYLKEQIAGHLSKTFEDKQILVSQVKDNIAASLKELSNMKLLPFNTVCSYQPIGYQLVTKRRPKLVLVCLTSGSEIAYRPVQRSFPSNRKARAWARRQVSTLHVDFFITPVAPTTNSEFPSTLEVEDAASTAKRAS